MFDLALLERNEREDWLLKGLLAWFICSRDFLAGDPRKVDCSLIFIFIGDIAYFLTGDSITL